MEIPLNWDVLIFDILSLHRNIFYGFLRDCLRNISSDMLHCVIIGHCDFSWHNFDSLFILVFRNEPFTWHNAIMPLVKIIDDLLLIGDVLNFTVSFDGFSFDSTLRRFY